MKKIIYIGIGCLCVLLGAIGAMLPMIPSVPFLLVATFCFARSSQRLYHWFIQTNLYKNHLESYVIERGMTNETKKRIIITISILMLIGFVIMYTKDIVIGCISLMIIWILHIWYFVCKVKTIEKECKNYS